MGDGVCLDRYFSVNDLQQSIEAEISFIDTGPTDDLDKYKKVNNILETIISGKDSKSESYSSPEKNQIRINHAKNLNQKYFKVFVNRTLDTNRDRTISKKEYQANKDWVIDQINNGYWTGAENDYLELTNFYWDDLIDQVIKNPDNISLWKEISWLQDRVEALDPENQLYENTLNRFVDSKNQAKLASRLWVINTNAKRNAAIAKTTQGDESHIINYFLGLKELIKQYPTIANTIDSQKLLNYVLIYQSQYAQKSFVPLTKTELDRFKRIPNQSEKNKPFPIPDEAQLAKAFVQVLNPVMEAYSQTKALEDKLIESNETLDFYLDLNQTNSFLRRKIKPDNGQLNLGSLSLGAMLGLEQQCPSFYGEVKDDNNYSENHSVEGKLLSSSDLMSQCLGEFLNVGETDFLSQTVFDQFKTQFPFNIVDRFDKELKQKIDQKISSDWEEIINCDNQERRSVLISQKLNTIGNIHGSLTKKLTFLKNKGLNIISSYVKPAKQTKT